MSAEVTRERILGMLSLIFTHTIVVRTVWRRSRMCQGACFCSRIIEHIVGSGLQRSNIATR
jgi:hypothetical protein